MNWIEIPAGKYKVRTNDRQSHCQIEINVKYFFSNVAECRQLTASLNRYSDLISHAPDGEWSKVAPLRILSFDIECAGRKGIFPEAEIDPVIQIANMVTRQGQPSTSH